MKTILYQPLFINPQAYFVFPQLYHIEKGDSYIEPANITGQLIINDLTKVLTSTPTLNVVQDTNQVDFGLFKGKHIRISQYTNIGAVVLGEWYIQGKLNSGMGVYKFDFLSDLRINSAYIPYLDRQEDKICSLIGHPVGWLFQFISLSDIPAFKVEVKGIVNDRFVYRYYDENGNRGEYIINKDGIYELPISYSVKNNTGVGIVCNNVCVDNVCFTQIPDYPDQLCYDGKMYAVAYGDGGEDVV